MTDTGCRLGDASSFLVRVGEYARVSLPATPDLFYDLVFQNERTLARSSYICFVHHLHVCGRHSDDGDKEGIDDGIKI